MSIKSLKTFVAALVIVFGGSAMAGEGGKPNIIVIATGGTIAGVGASGTQTSGYAAATLGIDTLLAAVPDIHKIANVKGEQLMQVASESMLGTLQLKMAKRINELLDNPDVDGVVVTHGTDTTEETAYFLNLTVKSTKPVVMTAAMRPSTAISADGPMNLYNAVLIASTKESAGKGVMVTLNDQITGARDVTKNSTVALEAFRSHIFGHMGFIAGGKPNFYNVSTRKHTVNTEFDVSKTESLPNVEIVYGATDANMIAANAFVAAGAKALVYAGPGNGSMSASVKPAMADLRKKGVLIVRSNHTGSGMTVRNGEAPDDKMDFVTADTNNPQKARILTQLGLTKTTDTKELQRMFDTY